MNHFARRQFLRNLLLAAALLLPCLGSAEVVMRLELPQKKYMLYEPVIATITLRNNSGQVLVCGGEAELKGELELELQNAAGRPRPGTGTRIPLSGLLLRPGVDHTIKVELSRHCPFDQLGLYQLAILFRHPMLTETYTSNKLTLSVAEGLLYWERKFGVPKMVESQAADPVKLRSYSIYCLQDNGTNRFYFRISDADHIYYQCTLGEAAGSRGPSCQLDTLNRLYILMPRGDKYYHLQLFDWNGEKDKSEYYRASKTVPALYRDPATGNVVLLGGEAVTTPQQQNAGKPLLDLPDADSGTMPPTAAPVPSAPAAPESFTAQPAAVPAASAPATPETSTAQPTAAQP